MVMKRSVSAFLTIAVMLATFSFASLNTAADMPSADILDGYENVCLTYTFRYGQENNGAHNVDDLMPYVAYHDINGNIRDFFFDSYLFLPCVTNGPSGARMHVDSYNPTKAIDWTAYVEDTFAEGLNVNALDVAYGNAKKALGDSESKAGVFLTVLYPCDTATDFGELGGRKLDFSKMDDRKYAVKWMIDEQLRLYNEANYENLELVGFYWLEEFLVKNSDLELLQYTSDYLHSLGLKFIWIPWYISSGYNLWDTMGFDVACMQPNMYWMKDVDYGRVEDCINIAKREGMGMEIEIDHRVFTRDEYYDRYLTYLEKGMNGGAMDSVKMYYQDAKTAVYYAACHSDGDLGRSVYDLTYKYAKGTLTQADIDEHRSKKYSLPENVEWISNGKKYKASMAYTNESGENYHDVDNKELTDGVFGTTDYGTEWHAFHKSNLDADGRMSVTIDLGTVRNDLTHFVAEFNYCRSYGIGTPYDINISVSEDGDEFKNIGEAELLPSGDLAYAVCETECVSGRYVKLSFSPDKNYNFVFLSEFLVGVDDNKAVSETDPESHATQVNSEVTSVSDDDSPNRNVIIAVCVGAVSVMLCVIIFVRYKSKK